MSNLFYATDVDPLTPGVITSMSGFAPLASGHYASASNALIAALSDAGVAIRDVTFAKTFRQVDGTVRLILFRKDKIGAVVSNGYSALNTGYSASTTRWDAAAWGNQIIAVNYLNNPQSSTGAAFSDLGGTPPRARCVAVNADFVMFGDTDDSVSGLDDSGVYSDMVWWSAISNPASWAPSIASQAGNFRLRDTPGPIRRVVAYRDGFVVFKANSIYVGEYQGTPYLWGWRLLSAKQGLIDPRAVCELNGLLYFVAESGVYEFDGSSMREISTPIWRSLRINTNGYPTAVTQLAGDPVEGVVWIATAFDDGRGTYTTTLTGYNTRSQKWGRLGEVVFTTVNPSILVDTFYADMAQFIPSDSASARARLMIVDNNNDLRAFRYPDAWVAALPASITTGLIGSYSGSSTAYRVQPRCLTPTQTSPFDSCAFNGMSNEQGTVGLQTASCTENTEFDSWDGLLSARFIRAQLAGQTGKLCILGGIEIMLQKNPAR